MSKMNVKHHANNWITVEIGIRLSDDIMNMEEAVQTALNEGGAALVASALEHLDIDGEPVTGGGEIWRSKGKFPRQYQTSFGKVGIERYLYQKSGGGKTLCPMEQKAHIIENATPRFAKQIASKMARMPVRDVIDDLQENHDRKIHIDYLQKVSIAVAAIARAKEEKWNFDIPQLNAPVATIGISLDGTCMLMCDSGWREAMVGSLSLYDERGRRMHSIYLGAAPEHGRAKFLKRLTCEIERLKKRYPDAKSVGIADGAKCNRDFLDEHTDTQILDFFHASGYLASVAEALHPKCKVKREQWVVENRHALKHDKGGAQKLYEKMVDINKNIKKRSKNIMKKLSDAVTYFENHKHQMDYYAYRKKKFPIGSGVIEAACKRLVKHRMCQSGMRWKEEGAAAVLSLRSLVLTKSSWQQFWEKLGRYGLPIEQNA